MFTCVYNSMNINTVYIMVSKCITIKLTDSTGDSMIMAAIALEPINSTHTKKWTKSTMYTRHLPDVPTHVIVANILC